MPSWPSWRPTTSDELRNDGEYLRLFKQVPDDKATTRMRVMQGAKFDNPSVGLLPCREKSDVVAEWSLRNVEKPVGASSYRMSDVLPSAEDIRQRVLGTIRGDGDE